MDHTTQDGTGYQFDLPEDSLGRSKADKQHSKSKMRRRPLRKNRKPSRPNSYIGKRTNKRD
jgi:hypothetical protein